MFRARPSSRWCRTPTISIRGIMAEMKAELLSPTSSLPPATLAATATQSLSPSPPRRSAIMPATRSSRTRRQSSAARSMSPKTRRRSPTRPAPSRETRSSNPVAAPSPSRTTCSQRPARRWIAATASSTPSWSTSRPSTLCAQAISWSLSTPWTPNARWCRRR